MVEAAAARLRDAASALIPALTTGTGGKVTWAYNPLELAWASHQAYIQRYSGLGAKTLLVGMNPGHGMGNTGVPFGCPEQVRETLGITGLAVKQPPRTHPKRPVYGLDCPKPEVSGRRIWTYLRERFGSAEAAHAHIYIVNHCPLWMFNDAGQNITPDKISGPVARELKELCDQHLREVVESMGITRIIGVGRYAQRQAAIALPEMEVDWMPHPSPASPFANRNGGADWRAAFDAALDRAGI